MRYKDLRAIIQQMKNLQAVRHIEGADLRFEIEGVTEVAAGLTECPAPLFDRIKEFRTGYRIFPNASTTLTS